MSALYLLFESASGYALFERVKSEGIQLSAAQRDITDLKRFQEIVKFKGNNNFSAQLSNSRLEVCGLRRRC